MAPSIPSYNLDSKRYAPYIPEIRPSSSPSSKNTGPVLNLLSRKLPRIASRAMGTAIVKPNCPTKASDPQTEGGCFLFMFSGAIFVAPAPPCPRDFAALLALTVFDLVSLLLYQWDYSTRNRRCATGDTKRPYTLSCRNMQSLQNCRARPVTYLSFAFLINGVLLAN